MQIGKFGDFSIMRTVEATGLSPAIISKEEKMYEEIIRESIEQLNVNNAKGVYKTHDEYLDKVIECFRDIRQRILRGVTQEMLMLGQRQDIKNSATRWNELKEIINNWRDYRIIK